MANKYDDVLKEISKNTELGMKFLNINEDGTFSVGGKKNIAYETYEEALEFVTARQTEKIENVAEKCKGSIPMCAYEAC